MSADASMDASADGSTDASADTDSHVDTPLYNDNLTLSNHSGWPFWEIGESEDHRFESGAWLSQTNDFKIDTCRFLAWRSTLLANQSRQGLVGSVSG